MARERKSIDQLNTIQECIGALENLDGVDKEAGNSLLTAGKSKREQLLFRIENLVSDDSTINDLRDLKAAIVVSFLSDSPQNDELLSTRAMCDRIAKHKEPAGRLLGHEMGATVLSYHLPREARHAVRHFYRFQEDAPQALAVPYTKAITNLVEACKEKWLGGNSDPIKLKDASGKKITVPEREQQLVVVASLENILRTSTKEDDKKQARMDLAKLTQVEPCLCLDRVVEVLIETAGVHPDTCINDLLEGQTQSAQGAEGDRLLHVVCRVFNSGYSIWNSNAARFLCNQGADQKLRDSKGKTPEQILVSKFRAGLKDVFTLGKNYSESAYYSRSHMLTPPYRPLLPSQYLEGKDVGELSKIVTSSQVSLSGEQGPSLYAVPVRVRAEAVQKLCEIAVGGEGEGKEEGKAAAVQALQDLQQGQQEHELPFSVSRAVSAAIEKVGRPEGIPAGLINEAKSLGRQASREAEIKAEIGGQAPANVRTSQDARRL